MSEFENLSATEKTCLVFVLVLFWPMVLGFVMMHVANSLVERFREKR